MHKKHRDNRGQKQGGFTLLELAIVLVILALVASGIMTLMAQDIRATKQAQLDAQLEAIHDAILDYRRRYNTLPCPARIGMLPSSAAFGLSQQSGGDCTSDITDGSNTLAGELPVRSLELPDSMMFDPWGGRFTYAVDRRVVDTGGDFTFYPANDTTIGSMTVYDSSGTARTTNAVVIVVSHGPNGHGAYQVSGARKSSGSVNADEMMNCHCDETAATGTFTPDFFQHEYTGHFSDILNNFDDTVIYYVRSQLLSAEELE